MSLLEPIRAFVEERTQEFDQIEADRRAQLDAMAAWVRGRRHHSEPASLIFICSHNSRRSHMAQIWAAAAADHYGITGVVTYSGGTEATAFNPRAVQALRDLGFDIQGNEKASNPRYRVRFATTLPPLIAYSKRYDDGGENPRTNFAAVMTCSQADAECPVVAGAMARFAVSYDDPKASDGSDREAEAYAERCRQIAREMLYAFSKV